VTPASLELDDLEHRQMIDTDTDTDDEPTRSS
jgi:hypothetical protein